MSFDKSRAVKLAAVLGVGIVLAGCQDTVAPIVESEFRSEHQFALQSRGLGLQKQLIKDQYLVVLRDGGLDVESTSASLIRKTKGKVNRTYKSGLRGFSAAMTAEEAAMLSGDPAVAYVEQDQMLSLAVGKPTTDGSSGGGKGRKKTSGGTGTVQDSPPSWGIDRIDQSQLPLSKTYVYSTTGAGVHVYIVDSGIRTTHAEFGGRATADYSVIEDGYGATGCNWHGSHVAGTVGGITVGVAKAVQFHSVRVLDCNGAGTTGTVAAGIDWVITNAVYPAVINLSVSAPSSQFLMDAVQRAIEAGITVVVAAGNDGGDACNHSPANVHSAITVGSTDMYDAISAFSNQGSCVDLMAPGQYISSVANTDDTGLQYGTGTSMAAPHVTGAVALYLALNPLSSPETVSQWVIERAGSGLLSGATSGTANLLLSTQ